MIPHETITSTANPRVRQAALLRDAHARRETGLTLVDGRRELSSAAHAGVAVEEVFVTAEALRGVTASTEGDGGRWLEELADQGTRIVSLSPQAFAKIAFGSRNEGCVGVVRFAGQPLERFTLPVDDRARRPVFLIEGVEKPGNLGAILRTADAAGLAGVIVCDGRTDPANPAVIRASLGTVFTVPLAVAKAREAIEWCQTHSRRVIAACPEGSLPWHEARLAGPAAILLGSEAHGLSPEWQSAAASGTIQLQSIHLPMLGSADSLNVSATAAVLAYEALRQQGTTP